jgi:hypothetical protein
MDGSSVDLLIPARANLTDKPVSGLQQIAAPTREGVASTLGFAPEGIATRGSGPIEHRTVDSPVGGFSCR